ncbi:hypothetical protein HUJ05_008553 [Dendroctonus ponderosae]|nr:hypothetical protein HUJ05_008553 [Dendroctonus ponderosae]
MSTAKPIYLDVDASIVENNLRLTNESEYEFSKIFEARSREPPCKTVKPRPGQVSAGFLLGISQSASVSISPYSLIRSTETIVVSTSEIMRTKKFNVLGNYHGCEQWRGEADYQHSSNHLKERTLVEKQGSSICGAEIEKTHPKVYTDDVIRKPAEDTSGWGGIEEGHRKAQHAASTFPSTTMLGSSDHIPSHTFVAMPNTTSSIPKVVKSCCNSCTPTLKSDAEENCSHDEGNPNGSKSNVIEVLLKLYATNCCGTRTCLHAGYPQPNIAYWSAMLPNCHQNTTSCLSRVD